MQADFAVLPMPVASLVPYRRLLVDVVAASADASAIVLARGTVRHAAIAAAEDRSTGGRVENPRIVRAWINNGMLIKMTYNSPSQNHTEINGLRVDNEKASEMRLNEGE